MLWSLVYQQHDKNQLYLNYFVPQFFPEVFFKQVHYIDQTNFLWYNVKLIYSTYREAFIRITCALESGCVKRYVTLISKKSSYISTGRKPSHLACSKCFLGTCQNFPIVSMWLYWLSTDLSTYQTVSQWGSVDLIDVKHFKVMEWFNRPRPKWSINNGHLLILKSQVYMINVLEWLM